MKSLAITLLSLVCFISISFANGVGILDASIPIYLRMDSSTVSVSVESQISTTVTTQYFTNMNTTRNVVKYAFPLTNGQSVIQLRWKVGGTWYTASIVGVPQDTTLPGGGTTHPNLLTYLGHTPLFYAIPQHVLRDSSLVVELTYVELLPYSFGSVTYTYPGDYHLIQSSIIYSQYFDFNLTSPRTIDSIRVVSTQPVDQISNSGDTAHVLITSHESFALQNFVIQYSLNAAQLGLYSYSTLQPDTLVPDTLGRGFLTFIAEPSPDTSLIAISKVFTLIIDRSGSMSGTKITQARNAATYVVQHLNTGDRFNLIDFDDVITSFRPTHVLYTPQTRDSAFIYINGLTARNLTSISGAFGTAVPQFTGSNDSTANIIIFLTDGQPTAGITNVTTLVNYVDSLIIARETHISVFCFGIGTDVNQQLLTLIASHNHGFASFLGNDSLYTSITNFYNTIRYPVLLNSHISFTPSIITQVYPDSLPNLYRGNQMIVSGRYAQAGNVSISLSGTAFGHPVSYNYDVTLTEASVTNNQFLPKIWAKQKIESLLVRYYSLTSTSPAALALRAQIIALSQAYGVISPFTSFSGGTSSAEERPGEHHTFTPLAFELLGNYPNPFNPTTTIKLRLNTMYTGVITIRIYNTLGQVVRVLTLQANGIGEYEIVWDGLGTNGAALANGMYFYAVDLHNTILVGKMQMLK